MVLLHTPRTAYHIGKGLLKRHLDKTGSASIAGLGSSSPYIYTTHLGVSDIDYLGHMNNASYLTHAELARWQWTAYNGMMHTMINQNVFFVVTGTTIRYRRELKSLFKTFQVDTSMIGIDKTTMWINHNFRYPAADDNNKKGAGRVIAQLLVQGAALNGRNIIEPEVFLKENCGVDSTVVDSLILESSPNSNSTMTETVRQYEQLETLMKQSASEDDDAIRKMK